MLARHLATDRSKTLFAQRLLLGLVMLPHGAQKTLGLFGGYGFTGTMAYFTGTMHLPSVISFLVIAAESAGAVGLVLGLGTRAAALGVAANMIGAVVTTHLRVGFFMNWFGNQAGEGCEYHLLALGLAIPLLVRGGGAWAVDDVLAGWIGRARAAQRLTGTAQTS